MNAYKINQTGRLPNGTSTIGNYTARAIFSSTIRYIQFPINLYNIIIRYLLNNDLNLNTTTEVRLDKDLIDGQYYYYASCKL